MIGLDTNIVLRYLLQDDDIQTAIVGRLVDEDCTEASPGFISLATVLETVWVLRSRFRWSSGQVAELVRLLLATENFRVQNEQQVFEAMVALQEGRGEFEDALIGELNAWSGCTETVTFDRDASRLPYFRLLR